jgi:hypothetical protein
MCRVQVQLWCAEQVQGSLEIDSPLKVFKSDPAVGQMLGLAASEVNRKMLSKCVLGTACIAWLSALGWLRMLAQVMLRAPAAALQD